MTWIAAHQSPTGLLERYAHTSREAAAVMLYATMCYSVGREAREQLEASTADFLIEIDGHWFSLSNGEAMPQDWAGAASSAADACVAPSMTGSVGAAYDVTSLDLPGGVDSTTRPFSAAGTSIAAPSLSAIHGAR